MAVIRERLRVDDEFSATFKKFNAAANAATQAANIFSNALGAIGNLAATFGAVKLVNTFIETSDAMSQMQAKLNVINDGLQTTAELNNMIFASAQRSRGSYEETANLVARLGQNAKEAFGSNAETILFAENLNKAFKIAGATAQEQASVILQLSQALGSGVLRGQEFNAVMAGAPNVIRMIAEEMDVPVGQMRDLAAEGKITADIVKRAMLNATDDINDQFAAMPKTWSDMIQEGKNMLQYALADAFSGWTEFINTDEWQEIMQLLISGIVTLAKTGTRLLMGLGNAVIWLKNNWEKLAPAVSVAAAAFATLKAISMASAITSAAAFAISHWWIIALGMGVVQISKKASEMGVTFGDVGRFVGGVFGGLYAAIYNIISDLWNVVAAFVEFFANVWSDPMGSVARLFVSFADTVLSVLETIADGMDWIFGSNMGDSLREWRRDMQSWADDKFGESNIKVDRMGKLDYVDTAITFGQKGFEMAGQISDFVSEISEGFNAVDEINSQLSGLDELINAVGDTGQIANVGTVNKIEGDVNLADEDVKVLRDLAEMKYMQKIELKTLAPEINVLVPESASGTLSAEDIAEAVQVVLVQQMSSHTATAH